MSAIDPLLTVNELAAWLRITRVAVYQAVKQGRLPRPIYPLKASPRWYRSEVQAVLDASRAAPSEQKIAA